jgi:hypothetical protein
MSEPYIASAKVVAAGAVNRDVLRATVMLTPGFSGQEASSRENLEKWPSQLWEWLRLKQWKLRLRVKPVVFTGTLAHCTSSSIKGAAEVIVADASAACQTWEARRDLGWVNSLWRNAYGEDASNKIWSHLATAIRDSHDGHAMSAGEGLTNSHPPKVTSETVAPQDNAASAKVESILPSPQSELALLLEYKRAFELCDTAHYRFPSTAGKSGRDPVDTEALSLANAQVGKDENGTRILDVSHYCSAAVDQFKIGQSLAQRPYEAKTCQPLPRRNAALASDPDSVIRPDDARPSLEDTLQKPLDAFQAANQRQETQSCATDPVDCVRQAYYAVQGSPTLSRLFALTIDVEFPMSVMQTLLNKHSGDLAALDGSRFLYLALEEDSLCREGIPCTVFTLAKWRPGSGTPHFWPASHAEVSLGPQPQSEDLRNLGQYEGLIVAGQPLYLPGGTAIPRFELSSLDIRSAAEGALDRRASEATEAEVRQQCAVATPATRPAAISRKTHLTAGLVVLDRGRQHQATAQLAARTEHYVQINDKNAVIALDSEDLTIGYRFDVGVPLNNDAQRKTTGKPTTTPGYAWRALMAREMRYGTSGPNAKEVRSVVRSLFLEVRDASEDTSSWRQVVEDGVLALPARIVPRAQADANAGGGEQGSTQVDAYVEEAIGTWTGEPMSVSCVGTRDTKVVVNPKFGLPTGCVVKVPTSRHDRERRTPALRFGRPFRVGIRAVYSGGISVPLENAELLYDESADRLPLGGALTIPVVPQGPFRRRDQLRRFLRHERINAPFLLLPEEHALQLLGPMGYERAAHAILRTIVGRREHERAVPAVTQRILVVPSVSKAFAAMHRVFDATSAEHPREGLEAPRFGPYGVRFDADDGGFPVVTSDAIVGINGVSYVTSRRLSTKTEASNPDSGDLVYSTSAPFKPKRKHPYYPDPAVRSYAVGVRLAGTATYLSGGACTIDVYGGGYAYPDARPLALTLQRSSSHAKRGMPPTLKEVLTWPKTGGDGRVSGHAPGAKRFVGSVEAILTLAPGDDFEVDVWCIPDRECLGRLFAVIEAIGTLAIARASFSDVKDEQGQAKTVRVVPTKARVCAELQKVLPEIVCAEVDKCLLEVGINGDQDLLWDEGCGGPGGLPAPGRETLQAIARGIHDALSLGPLDEIAAVRTLRATHAIDQPSHPARLNPATPLVKSNSTFSPYLELRRVKDDDARTEHYDGAGEIQIHLATTGSLEVRAEVASPSSDRLDDPRRGRSLRDRRTGRWPKREDGSAVPMRDIFGFDIAEDGEVTFPRKEIILHRLDEIPQLPKAPSVPPSSDNGLCCIPLKEVLAPAGPGDFGNSKPSFQFTDGLARQLVLNFVAYGRHSEQMRKANSPGRNGYWLRDGAYLEAKDASKPSEPIHAWLQASVRPAEPGARTPVPAFLWSETATKASSRAIEKQLTRRSIVRIPLSRPWFSSGEEERLGIVIWPPTLFSQDPLQFDKDIVETRRVSGLASDHARQMSLPDFHDEDLGAGGKFVTRWGGDPMRTPAELQMLDNQAETDPTKPAAVPYLRTFVPASAFVDYYTKAADLVPNVSLPVRVTEGASAGATTTGTDSAARTPPLVVSLLTYKPKFDRETEQWFVDVTIEHPREAEPFVRFGLVRYQPYAPDHSCVSYPTTQWTQLLPRRTVHVRADRRAHDAICVTVRVEGLATAPRRQATDADNERPAVSRMIASVVRENPIDSSRSDVLSKDVHKRPIVPEFELERCQDALSDVNVAEAYLATWQSQLHVPRDSQRDAQERASYYVFVEEREDRLPATYAEEPVSPQMAKGLDCDGAGLKDVLIKSGPRFLARIEI